MARRKLSRDLGCENPGPRRLPHPTHRCSEVDAKENRALNIGQRIDLLTQLYGVQAELIT